MNHEEKPLPAWLENTLSLFFLAAVLGFLFFC
jgi:hypothetical protein